MEKLKVWIITYNYGSVKAGPVIRFTRYMPLFEKEGCTVKFVTINRDDPPSPEAIFLPNTDRVTFLFNAAEKALTDKPDVMVFLSTNYKITPQLVKLKKAGINCIYVNTMKLSLSVDETGKPRGWLKSTVLKFLSKRMYKTFDHIVNSTSTLQNEFLELGLEKEKLNIIYNGVNTDTFAPITPSEKLSLRAKLDLPDNDFLFLFVGLMVQRKGVLELVKSWIEYKEQHQGKGSLVLIGDEMEGIAENSQEWLKEWHQIKPILKDPENKYQIIYGPFVSNIHEYYKAVDAFVFLSYLEGMPNVLLESMSTGLPVLCAKFEGISDDYGNNNEEIVLLENRQPQTLIPIYKKLVEDNSWTTKISDNARNHALVNFSLSESIKAYVSLFRK